MKNKKYHIVETAPQSNRKMKNKKYHIVETAPNSNIKIVERGQIYIPNTQIHWQHTFQAWYRHFNEKKVAWLNYFYGPKSILFNPMLIIQKVDITIVNLTGFKFLRSRKITRAVGLRFSYSYLFPVFVEKYNNPIFNALFSCTCYKQFLVIIPLIFL